MADRTIEADEKMGVQPSRGPIDRVALLAFARVPSLITLKSEL